MTRKELENVAEVLGIRVPAETDADLFKAILGAEDLAHCFGLAAHSCSRSSCLLKGECETRGWFVRYLC